MVIKFITSLYFRRGISPCYLTYKREAPCVRYGIKIVAIGNIGEFNGSTKRINLSGKLVMPGGVDPHTHIEGYSSAGTIKKSYILSDGRNIIC